MRKPTKITLAVLVCLGLAWLAIRSIPQNPVAIIKVVDITGKPVAGAVIRPDGLRPKRINGHWGWSEDNPVKPTPAKTDARGFARIPYPRYVVEKTETGEISFQVEHPDFCSDRPFRVVSATPPANASLKTRADYLYRLVTGRLVTSPTPVILKRGGIIKVSGYLGNKTNLLADIHPQLASMRMPRKGFWQSAGSGVLMNRRVPEGTNALRLVYLQAEGRACFSDPVTFVSRAGQTNEYCLELKPGLEFGGKLDDSVPRPVTGGQLQISVCSESMNTNQDFLVWHLPLAIKPDGTFLVDSLPAGKAEVIAICNGFKSRDGAGPKVSNFVLPQIFQLGKSTRDAVVTMEPTASLEVTVLDDKQQPLANAAVFLWPNVLAHGGSGIFMGPTVSSEYVLRSTEDFNWRTFRKDNPQRYEAWTDEHGVATVSNLPAFKQWFSVSHTNYELPIEPVNDSRAASAVLNPGETTRATVTLRKKGAEFLQSPK